MPVTIIIGLLSLLVALVLYSIGAWGAFRSKSFEQRHVTYFAIGFVFDVLATAMMAIQAGGLDLSPLPDLLHTVVALVAMALMLVVALIGWRANASGNSALKTILAKWVLAPWALWLLVFVWGMIARGSTRM